MNPILKLIGEAEDFSEYEDILALDAEQDKTLFSRPVPLTPKEAYTKAFRLGKANVTADLEKIIATHPQYAHDYAQVVLGTRFPLGEHAIAKHAQYAYSYAYSIVMPGDFVPKSKRFPLGEPAIAQHARLSSWYSMYVLKRGDFVPGSKRFPPGEAAIATEAQPSFDYAMRVLKSRFTAGEPAIKRNDPLWQKYKVHFNLL